jgi:hypothetical protein
MCSATTAAYSLLMGHALEYDIANVVDPHFTVVAKIQKKFLNAE